MTVINVSYSMESQNRYKSCEKITTDTIKMAYSSTFKILELTAKIITND